MLFFATENSKQPKITYLQHVSFTFIFFPFDVSFYFFSRFLFSFSFFSLVISALRAFLFFLLHFPFFSSRSLFPTRFNLTLATTATHTVFVPFPSIWRRFSPRPVLAPVQKFNAIKQPPFRFRCKLLTFTDFVDLLSGGIVARLWEIVEIWGVSVRNRACSSIEPCLKSVLCHP